MSVPKLIIAATLLTTGIVSIGIVSNKVLDKFGIASGVGLTIEQSKEKARRNQQEWDRLPTVSEEIKLPKPISGSKSSQMCADPGIVKIAQGLINEEFPSVARLGATLEQLDISRGGGRSNTIELQKKYLERTKEDISLHPATSPNYAQDQANSIKRIEETIAKLQARQKAQFETEKVTPETIPDNEVVVLTEPFPVQYDPDLNRVTCQMSFQIKGPAYETINAVQGNRPRTAIYSVQPGRDTWIVNLLSTS